MNFAQLFSFQGRQRRLNFWLVAIGLFIINCIVSAVTVGPTYMALLSGQTPSGGGGGVLGIVGLIVSLVIAWAAIANDVKRCHDRDKSGWWLLLMLLASLTVIGALWPLIELGFLDGTQGPNRFGPSPKGVQGPTAAPAAGSAT